MGLLIGCGGETGYYKVNVIDEFDFLLSEPKAYYKPGTKIVIKTVIIYDESYHIYVNGVELRSSGYGDHCNIYEFTMPEEDVELLLTFKDLYEKYEYQIYQLFGKIENIDKVAIYHKKQSFDEFDTREFSTDINDIERMLEMLNQEVSSRLPVREHTIEELKNRTIVQYYSNDELVIEIEFIDALHGFYNPYHYKNYYFTDETYTIPKLENIELTTYKFYRDWNDCDVKRISDDSVVFRYSAMDNIDFVPYSEELEDFNLEYYIDSGYGKIYLISDRLFILNNEVYEIVSNSRYWAYSYFKKNSIK